MNLNAFHASLQDKQPPPGLNALLNALWYDAKGDWEKSHNIISELNSKEAALIHAYLHRKEGDQWNADYWYRRAGTQRQDITLEAEWESLVKLFST